MGGENQWFGDFLGVEDFPSQAKRWNTKGKKVGRINWRISKILVRKFNKTGEEIFPPQEEILNLLEDFAAEDGAF